VVVAYGVGDASLYNYRSICHSFRSAPDVPESRQTDRQTGGRIGLAVGGTALLCTRPKLHRPPKTSTADDYGAENILVQKLHGS